MSVALRRSGRARRSKVASHSETTTATEAEADTVSSADNDKVVGSPALIALQELYSSKNSSKRSPDIDGHSPSPVHYISEEDAAVNGMPKLGEEETGSTAGSGSVHTGFNNAERSLADQRVNDSSRHLTILASLSSPSKKLSSQRIQRSAATAVSSGAAHGVINRHDQTQDESRESDEDVDEDDEEDEDDPGEDVVRSNGRLPPPKAGNGSGSSCHQCKSRRQGLDLVFCCNMFTKRPGKGRRRVCRKKYCWQCLQKFYKEKAPAPEMRHSANSTWACPACRSLCCCALCRRVRLQKDAPKAAAPGGLPDVTMDAASAIALGIVFFKRIDVLAGEHSGAASRAGPALAAQVKQHEEAASASVAGMFPTMLPPSALNGLGQLGAVTQLPELRSEDIEAGVGRLEEEEDEEEDEEEEEEEEDEGEDEDGDGDEHDTGDGDEDHKLKRSGDRGSVPGSRRRRKKRRVSSENDNFVPQERASDNAAPLSLSSLPMASPRPSGSALAHNRFSEKSKKEMDVNRKAMDVTVKHTPLLTPNLAAAPVDTPMFGGGHRKGSSLLSPGFSPLPNPMPMPIGLSAMSPLNVGMMSFASPKPMSLSQGNQARTGKERASPAMSSLQLGNGGSAMGWWQLMAASGVESSKSANADKDKAGSSKTGENAQDKPMSGSSSK